MFVKNHWNLGSRTLFWVLLSFIFFIPFDTSAIENVLQLNQIAEWDISEKVLLVGRPMPDNEDTLSVEAIQLDQIGEKDFSRIELEGFSILQIRVYGTILYARLMDDNSNRLLGVIDIREPEQPEILQTIDNLSSFTIKNPIDFLVGDRWVLLNRQRLQYFLYKRDERGRLVFQTEVQLPNPLSIPLQIVEDELVGDGGNQLLRFSIDENGFVFKTSIELGFPSLEECNFCGSFLTDFSRFRNDWIASIGSGCIDFIPPPNYERNPEPPAACEEKIGPLIKIEKSNERRLIPLQPDIDLSGTFGLNVETYKAFVFVKQFFDVFIFKYIGDQLEWIETITTDFQSEISITSAGGVLAVSSFDQLNLYDLSDLHSNIHDWEQIK